MRDVGGWILVCLVAFCIFMAGRTSTQSSDGRTREERAHAYIAQAMYEIGEPSFKIRNLELCYFRERKEEKRDELDDRGEWPAQWIASRGKNPLSYEFVGKPYPVQFVGGDIGVGYLLKITNTGDSGRLRDEKRSHWAECCRFEIAGRDEWSCVGVSSTQIPKVHYIHSSDETKPVSEWERVCEVGFRSSHIKYTNTETEDSDSIILRLVFSKR